MNVHGDRELERLRQKILPKITALLAQGILLFRDESGSWNLMGLYGPTTSAQEELFAAVFDDFTNYIERRVGSHLATAVVVEENQVVDCFELPLPSERN